MLSFAYEAAGALSARYSPRPLLRGRKVLGKPRANMCCEIAKLCPHVIASEAKQSSLLFAALKLDCFVAIAPRNDGSGCLKFESVGWAKARLRRAHHVRCNQNGGTLALCPPTHCHRPA